MSLLHAVLPAALDDPAKPSGGNVYDRKALTGLKALGWTVVEHLVGGGLPARDPRALGLLRGVLDALPDDSLVLVDGLVASAAPSVLPAAGGRLRIVVLVHMLLGPDPREEAVLSGAWGVVTTSEWARAQLREWYGLRRVEVCRPGSEPASVAVGTDAGSALLCVAAAHPGKGHDVLLEALAGVTNRPWTLTCVGSLDVDPDHVAALRRQVRARRWEHRVTFTGPLREGALATAYERSDLVVLASRAETYGMVLTEALAHGLPVLATRVGGVVEAVGCAPDGTSPALLTGLDDAPALSAALAAWLDDSLLRRRLRRAALSRRLELRGWSDTAVDLSGAIADLHGRAGVGLPR